MPLFSLDLLTVAVQRMRHSTVRQQTLAENVANADTPFQTTRDIAAFEFDREVELARATRRGDTAFEPGMLVLTSASHIASPTERGFKGELRPPTWEVLPGGNAVSLEQQMLAMVDSKLQHDQAAAYYRKATELIRASASARF